jgi:hypothetical protein
MVPRPRATGKGSTPGELHDGSDRPESQNRSTIASSSRDDVHERKLELGNHHPEVDHAVTPHRDTFTKVYDVRRRQESVSTAEQTGPALMRRSNSRNRSAVSADSRTVHDPTPSQNVAQEPEPQRGNRLEDLIEVFSRAKVSPLASDQERTVAIRSGLGWTKTISNCYGASAPPETDDMIQKRVEEYKKSILSLSVVRKEERTTMLSSIGRAPAQSRFKAFSKIGLTTSGPNL